ncbi:MAG: hypothetical protein ACTJGR_10485, partial [Pauljensenia sp.]
MFHRLAWVSAREARGLDEDEALALAALTGVGAGVEVVCWDDPQVDWSHFDRAVLRSTWDYHRHLAAFLDWLGAVDQVTDLVNPLEQVRWSLDKHYLAELERAGVPITPTVYVAPGDVAVFPEKNFVVKPAVGAGSQEAASYGPDQRGSALVHIGRLHAAGKVALVQPHLASVATEGEWPMVFFDGEFSHSASKRVDLPRARTLGGLFAPETTAAHRASAAQIDVARAALDVVSERLGTPTYARVDLVRDDSA